MLFHDTMVSFNNQTTKFYEVHRVCQGCLLAPCLFIIMIDPLVGVVKHVMVGGDLKGITLPQDNPKHIINYYVVDTSFIVKGKNN